MANQLHDVSAVGSWCVVELERILSCETGALVLYPSTRLNIASTQDRRWSRSKGFAR